jgi:lysophospholipase L1-like esterase
MYHSIMGSPSGWAGRRLGRLVATPILAMGVSCSSPASPTPAPTPIPTPAAPTITCPTDGAAQSADGSAVVVTYTAPAVTGGSTPVAVACTPTSGAPFPLGATTVSCTATDAIGRAAACGFSIRVTLTPRLRVSTLVAFGDSMTDGVIATQAPLFRLVSSPVSYPSQLQALLTARYSAQTIVVLNEGLDGESTTQGALRLPGVVSLDRPDVVLLMEGANDVEQIADQAVGLVADNMADMIRETRARGALPYLATLPPQRPGGVRAIAPDVVPGVNARLASLAADTGVVLVDIYAAFGGVAGDLIGPDGLHPTAAGYEKIAETFYDAIVKTLEVPAPAPTAARARRR